MKHIKRENHSVYHKPTFETNKVAMLQSHNEVRSMRRASTVPTEVVLVEHNYYNTQVYSSLTMNLIPEHTLRSSLRNVLIENILYFEQKAVISLQDVTHFIDTDDWEAMLGRNMKLFTNYILGQYLSANNQFAKMMWLKTGNMLLRDLWSLSFSEPEAIQVELCLFQDDDAMLKAYLGFAQMLRRMPIGFQHKAGMAQLILFYPGNLLLNKTTETNKHFQKIIHHFCSSNLGEEHMFDMFLTLEAMAELFDHSFLGQEGLLKCSRLCGPNDHQLIMGYTFEEGMWLGRLQETVMSKTVSMENHSDIVTELVNYAFYDTPLKPDFYKRTGRLFWERIWSIYLSYPEFLGLSAADKTVLFLNSFKTVYAVQCVMLDGLPMEQIGKIIFSDKDREDNVFLQYMCSNTNLTNNHEMPILKTPTLRDVYPHLPHEWATRCRNVSSVVRGENEHVSIFLYLTVSAMFDGIPAQAYRMPRWKAVSSLRQFHLLNLKRRFGSEYESMINHALCEFRILSTMVDFI